MFWRLLEMASTPAPRLVLSARLPMVKVNLLELLAGLEARLCAQLEAQLAAQEERAAAAARDLKDSVLGALTTQLGLAEARLGLAAEEKHKELLAKLAAIGEKQDETESASRITALRNAAGVATAMNVSAFKKKLGAVLKTVECRGCRGELHCVESPGRRPRKGSGGAKSMPVLEDTAGAGGQDYSKDLGAILAASNISVQTEEGGEVEEWRSPAKRPRGLVTPCPPGRRRLDSASSWSPGTPVRPFDPAIRPILPVPRPPPARWVHQGHLQPLAPQPHLPRPAEPATHPALVNMGYINTAFSNSSSLLVPFPSRSSAPLRARPLAAVLELPDYSLAGPAPPAPPLLHRCAVCGEDLLSLPALERHTLVAHSHRRA